MLRGSIGFTSVVEGVPAAALRYNGSNMPERPPVDLDTVRSVMRAHDRAPESAPAPAPPIAQGPTEMQDGVTDVTIDRDGDGRFQALRRELGVSTFGLNLIRLRPGQRGRIHRHERQEEVYLVLEGTLTLGIEGEERTVARDQLVRVAPAVRRQLTNRGPETLLLLAIGGAEAHEGRDGVAFADWEEREGRPPSEVPMPPDVER